MAAAGNGVIFKAQGGEIEHIKTGRKMTLVKKKEEITFYECGLQQTLQVFQGWRSERRVYPCYVACKT